MITLDVLLFASYADAAGAPSVQVTVENGACVADVVHALRAAAPRVVLPPRPLVSVNHQYASLEAIVGPADEVALFPPVAGG